MKLYLVGGTVRDHLLGKPSSNDYDFAVEAESYEAMKKELVAKGLHIWQERPQFVTLRGHLPRYEFGDFGGLIPAKPRPRQINADFTLCRAETMYSDKRHPDTVTPTDILNDLSRRDFTMNAIAVSEDGTVIDPYDGRGDIKPREWVRCVGETLDRFIEDPLRILRAIRFSVVYGFSLHPRIQNAFTHDLIVEGLRTLPNERIREELHKAMRTDWRSTMTSLLIQNPKIGRIIAFDCPDLWFKPTTESR